MIKQIRKYQGYMYDEPRFNTNYLFVPSTYEDRKFMLKSMIL